MINERKLIEKIKKWQDDFELYDEPTDIDEIEDNIIIQTLDDVLSLIDEVVREDKKDNMPHTNIYETMCPSDKEYIKVKLAYANISLEDWLDTIYKESKEND